MAFEPSYNILDKDTHNMVVEAFKSGGIGYTDADGTVHKISGEYVAGGAGGEYNAVLKATITIDAETYEHTTVEWVAEEGTFENVWQIGGARRPNILVYAVFEYDNVPSGYEDLIPVNYQILSYQSIDFIPSNSDVPEEYIAFSNALNGLGNPEYTPPDPLIWTSTFIGSLDDYEPPEGGDDLGPK